MPRIKPEKTSPVEHGENIPWRCPVCHSLSHEFVPEEDRVHLAYDSKKFNVLLINGSTHRSGNTGYMADLAEEVLHEREHRPGILPER